VPIKDQKVEVECRMLCGSALIDDLCKDGRTDCEKIVHFNEANGAVTCQTTNPGTYALFVNDQEMTGNVMCKREGWIEKNPIDGQEKTILDFMNPVVTLPVRVLVECRKLCEESLIKDLCDDDRFREKKDCMKKIYNPLAKTVNCGGADNYALYVNEQLRAGAVSCTRKGWIEGLQPIIDFTNGVLQKNPPPQNVKVECRKLCGSFAFKDSCKNESSEKWRSITMGESCDHIMHTGIHTCTF
ncbi:hypothetical protein PENTCL1PPCAC_19023, partial [Pristionchus entomophagus]